MATPPNVTAILEILNNSPSLPALVRNMATPSDTADGKGDVPPGEPRVLTIWIPWCSDGLQFDKKNITVTVGIRTFKIWQASHNGVDRVRVSTDGAWHDPGDEIGGFAAVGPLAPLFDRGDRMLVINDTSLWLLPYTLVQELRAAAVGYSICDQHID